MLTPSQQRTLEFIRQHMEHHGHAPSLQEIALGTGIRSKGVAHRYVHALAQAGLIELLPGRQRGIRLRDDVDAPPSPRLTLPLLGRIAAGCPIEAIPQQDEVDLSEFFMGPNRFVLKVQGKSMIEAGILDGDMVVVESREQAGDYDIVVALIDNEEATLKYIKYHSDGSITLIPANAQLEPIRYSAERIRVQGVVVGQMRSYR